MEKNCAMLTRVFCRIFYLSVLFMSALAVNSCDPEVPFDPVAAFSPEKGATVYGRVYCGDKPLEGVSVSDGVSVVRTDSEGVYNISSAKENGYVFVSVPSGYAMVGASASVPGFWKSLNKEKSVPERVDFSLVQENQDVFTMLLLGDTQVFSEKTLRLFKETVIPELNAYVPSVTTGPVYGLNLGDMTWDWYWYNDDRVGIDDYLLAVKGLHGLPLFHTVGNHDNDMQYDSYSEYRDTGEDRTCMNMYRSIFINICMNGCFCRFNDRFSERIIVLLKNQRERHL